MSMVGSVLEEGINGLKKEQIKLARGIIIKDQFRQTDVIGGVDQAFIDNRIISAAIVCDRRSFDGSGKWCH